MAKKAAYGTKLAIQRLQTGSYTDVANVGDISGPEVSVETIDVTTHDSADFFTEFLAGIADSGDVSFDLVFDPNLAAHETIYNDVIGRQKHNFYLKMPGWVSTAAGGYIAFAGIFTKIGLTFPVKSGIMAPVTIKVSGKPVYTKFV
jgi:hypothetical protein